MPSTLLFYMFTNEPVEQIQARSGIPKKELFHFRTFLDHVLRNSRRSPMDFCTFTFQFGLSWQVLALFFQEYKERLAKGHVVIPRFDKSRYKNEWHVGYYIITHSDPHEEFFMGDPSLVVCSVPYMKVPYQEIAGIRKSTVQNQTPRAFGCFGSMFVKKRPELESFHFM